LAPPFVAAIVLDEGLRRPARARCRRWRWGMGMYLPMDVSATVVVGAVLAGSTTAGRCASAMRNVPSGWACWRRPA
jgi:uncharacterized oligopeptide transporter (OPT) family protein